MANALSTIGRRDLVKHEATIEGGLKTFVAVGHALTAISEGRLYREDYETFDAYLRGRWGMSKSRGYQLMQSAEMSTTVDIENERQARELAGLDTEEAVEVVEEAKAGNNGKLTGPAIRKTREKRKNAQGKGSESSQPVATGDSVPVAEGERPNSRVDHGAGLGDPAASAAPPIDTTSREVGDVDCPYCHGSGRWDADRYELWLEPVAEPAPVEAKQDA